MKKNVGKFAFIAVMVIMLFAACGGGSNSQSPEKVAEKYIKALLKQDFSTMKKYASEKELKNVADQEAQFDQGVPAEKKELLKSLANAKTEVQPAEISEDTPEKAKVDINYTLKVEGEESSGTWKMKLVKEGEEWKVDGVSLK